VAGSAPELRDGFISIEGHRHAMGAGSERSLEFGAETAADCHVVKIVLRTMNIRFSVSGRTVQDGVTTPGTVHVTEPAYPFVASFAGLTMSCTCTYRTPIANAPATCPATRRRYFTRRRFQAEIS